MLYSWFCVFKEERKLLRKYLLRLIDMTENTLMNPPKNEMVDGGNNCSYHMEKLMPGVEKLLGKLLIPEGKLFDSEGESCFSERSEAKHSPEESKSLPEGIKSA